MLWWPYFAWSLNVQFVSGKFRHRKEMLNLVLKLYGAALKQLGIKLKLIALTHYSLVVVLAATSSSAISKKGQY